MFSFLSQELHDSRDSVKRHRISPSTFVATHGTTCKDHDEAFSTDLAIQMHLGLVHLPSNMADFRHITRSWRHTQNLYLVSCYTDAFRQRNESHSDTPRTSTGFDVGHNFSLCTWLGWKLWNCLCVFRVCVYVLAIWMVQYNYTRKSGSTCLHLM